MLRTLVAVVVISPLLLSGCEMEEAAPSLSPAQLNRIETYLDTSLTLSLLCTEAPLTPRQEAEANGNATAMLKVARSMADDVLVEGAPTVREDLHADAALFDSCMPAVARQIRTALNRFPPPKALYDEAP